jgi:hypothetical protein
MEQAIVDAPMGQSSLPARLHEAAHDAADEFERAAVDDVRGPVLEMVGCWCFCRGRGQLEGGHGDFVRSKKEQSAICGAAAGGDFGDELGGYSVEGPHESSEGIVNGLAGFLLFFGSELFAGGFGDLSCDDLGGVFLLFSVLLLSLLVTLDSFEGFVMGETQLFLGGPLAHG